MSRTYTIAYEAVEEKIQLGDVVMDFDGSTFTLSQGNMIANFTDRFKKAILALTYWQYREKIVLGRVSSEAKWVKRGDSFKDEDIELMPKDEDSVDLDVYRVKCNCGLFH